MAHSKKRKFYLVSMIFFFQYDPEINRSVVVSTEMRQNPLYVSLYVFWSKFIFIELIPYVTILVRSLKIFNLVPPQASQEEVIFLLHLIISRDAPLWGTWFRTFYLYISKWERKELHPVGLEPTTSQVIERVLDHCATTTALQPKTLSKNSCIVIFFIATKCLN